MSKPKVFLVGAGPGDKELITLKGLRLISNADVILYDHLNGFQLLDHAQEGADLISVGKFSAKHPLVQHKINALLIEKAKGKEGLEQAFEYLSELAFTTHLTMEDALARLKKQK